MKNILLALLTGILLAIGWPTYGFPMFLFFGFVPLLFAEKQLRTSELKRQGLRVFGLAYLAFFVWNVTTTSWLRHASLFGASFAVFVNTGLMALLILFYHKYAKRQTQNRALLFLVTLWISFEKLHLLWEFSWPWLNLGNGFSEYTNWVQWYEYTGTFGGTLWVWILNVVLFKGLLLYRKDRSKLKPIIFTTAGCLLIPIIVSFVILKTYKHDGKTVNVIALQPNIDPYSEKYNMTNIKFLELFKELSNAKITDSTDFIIAPETFFAESTPLNQFDNSLLKHRLQSYAREHSNVNIIAGISFIDWFHDKSRIRKETNTYKFRPDTWYDDYNSAILINTLDSIPQYNKSKLVVGVENFPYQSILKPIIGDAMIDLGGTIAMKTTQDYRSVFSSSNEEFQAAPIICYESVYGEFVTGYVRNGANFLAIVTNDAWWNETQGHKQHLSYAKLRAVETRRDIVRSANTGISAIINAKGEITDQLAYNEKGALSGQLTTNEQMTFYVLAGDYIARISFFILIFIFLIGFFRRPRTTL
ncbi:apolipoprotein N-acyltransferase [Psychroserpens sp. BH13MA-6]